MNLCTFILIATSALVSLTCTQAPQPQSHCLISVRAIGTLNFQGAKSAYGIAALAEMESSLTIVEGRTKARKAIAVYHFIVTTDT
jgi:hypothetical protein